jgi:hypothetical protein
LHRGASHQPDAVDERTHIADVERGLVAVEADIGERALRALPSAARVRIASNSASGMRTKPSVSTSTETGPPIGVEKGPLWR